MRTNSFAKFAKKFFALSIVILIVLFSMSGLAFAEYETNVGTQTECSDMQKESCDKLGSKICCVPDISSPREFDCLQECSMQYDRCRDHCTEKGCLDVLEVDAAGNCDCGGCKETTCSDGSQKVDSIPECSETLCKGKGYILSDNYCCTCLDGANACHQYCKEKGKPYSNWGELDHNCSCYDEKYYPATADSCEIFCFPNAPIFNETSDPKCTCNNDYIADARACQDHCEKNGLDGIWDAPRNKCRCEGDFRWTASFCDTYCKPDCGEWSGEATGTEDDCGCVDCPEEGVGSGIIPLEIGIGATDSVTGIADYIAQIYWFATAIVGSVAVIMIIIGGIQYSTAGGNQKAIASAKETIISAIIGLVTVGLGYLLLSTFGNQFVDLQEPDIQTIKPGQYDFDAWDKEPRCQWSYSCNAASHLEMDAENCAGEGEEGQRCCCRGDEKNYSYKECHNDTCVEIETHDPLMEDRCDKVGESCKKIPTGHCDVNESWAKARCTNGKYEKMGELYCCLEGMECVEVGGECDSREDCCLYKTVNECKSSKCRRKPSTPDLGDRLPWLPPMAN